MPRTRFIDPRAGSGIFEDHEPQGRPSIVFISVDMVPPDFYRPGETNSGLARTPSINRLRADGVWFEDAFANSPLCGPSRASYLTGRYPYLLVNEERAHDGMAVALRPDDIIFPEYLKAVGYVTKHVGKCHVGAAKFLDAFGEADAAWDRWAPPLTDDDGYVAHLRRLGVSPPVQRNPVRGRRADRKTPANSYGGFVTQADGSPFPEEATYPHYLAELTAERLDAALAQGVAAGAPLYLQVDFFAPHQPFMIPTELEGRAAKLRRQVKMPPSFLEAAEHNFDRIPGEPRIYELYRRSFGIYDEATMREYVVCNVLQMEVLDRAIGKVLAKLAELDLYEKSLLIFIADHGEMNGEKALLDKGAYCHPRVARVPFVVKPHNGTAAQRLMSRGSAAVPPGREQAGATVQTPICLLDIAPTLLEAAGETPGARLDGQSLWPLLREPGAADARADSAEAATSPREGGLDDRLFLFEACWHIAPNPAVAFQWRKSPSEHYFYAYNLTSDHDELYDLNDPTYRNQIGDPRCEETRVAMIQRLGAFLRADPRWRCYWHTMRIDKTDELPPEEGDLQMFRPE
jgi:arylsulfatase A-like enzyme